MRSLAEQHVAELGGRVSVLSRQKADHVRLDELLTTLRRVRGTAEEERVLARTYRLVFPHAFAEEAVLWPAIRRRLPDGEALTLRIEQEHQQVNELVVRLDAGRPGDPGRDALLDELMAVLDDDVRDEEDLLLPRLQEVIGPVGLRLLGVAWEVVRRTAPTRAHPVVARRPPGNALAAVPLSLLDRLRDLAGAVARRAPDRVSDASRRLDAVLARAAGAVERSPVLRRGEDPSTHRPPG